MTYQQICMPPLSRTDVLEEHDYIYLFVPESEYRIDGLWMVTKYDKSTGVVELLNIANGKTEQWDMNTQNIANMYLRRLTPYEKKMLGII